MLMVVLALALFSTIMLNMYNLVLDDAKVVYNNILYTQGQKIADRYFQQIESELLGSSPVIEFDDVHTNFNGLQTTETVGNNIYNVNLTTSYADSLGSTSSPDSSYIRVDVRMNCVSAAGDTLYIGTQSNPFSKVFFEIGM
ncbi:MAG: hypothetical protein K9N39_05220 [Candidatus Cloacimonetes bacterium]|nr:hypothetical protein [Candidatus Cloacimonadota bacterium]